MGIYIVRIVLYCIVSSVVCMVSTNSGSGGHLTQIADSQRMKLKDSVKKNNKVKLLANIIYNFVDVGKFC